MPGQRIVDVGCDGHYVSAPRDTYSESLKIGDSVRFRAETRLGDGHVSYRRIRRARRWTHAMLLFALEWVDGPHVSHFFRVKSKYCRDRGRSRNRQRLPVNDQNSGEIPGIVLYRVRQDEKCVRQRRCFHTGTAAKAGMRVSLAINSLKILPCFGSRWRIRTKAIPVSLGNVRSNSLKASSPPAEAPTATTRNGRGSFPSDGSKFS